MYSEVDNVLRDLKKRSKMNLTIVLCDLIAPTIFFLWEVDIPVPSIAHFALIFVVCEQFA